MGIQKQMRREKTWHLVTLLIALTAISPAITAAFDADSYNESQLKRLKRGDRVVIGVHGIRSRATDMQKHVEALVRMDSGHDKAVGFEYRQVDFILLTPFWVSSPDDNMSNWAIELAAIKLAVFIAQVKQKTGHAPDVFAYSQGSTILAKAAKWIAYIQEATRQGKDVATYLRSLPEWYCINIEVAAYLSGGKLYQSMGPLPKPPEWNFAHREEKLLLDNIHLLQQASIGTAVVAGSPTHVRDPVWQYLQKIVEKRTPLGRPAVFYVWSDGDIVVFYGDIVVILRGFLWAETSGWEGFSPDQIIFIRGIGHGGYFEAIWISIIAELFKNQRLSPKTAQALEEHNRGRKERNCLRVPILISSFDDDDDDDDRPPFFPPPPPPPPPPAVVGVQRENKSDDDYRDNGRKPDMPTYTLPEAIARGLVEVVGAAEPNENGGIRGILRLRKRTNGVFRVVITSGTVLKSNDPHSQSLVIW